MRTQFIKTLMNLAESDSRVFLVTADMGFNVLEQFQARFPDRFLNCGIAEQNAVNLAAGLASEGYRPFVYSIVPFVTMRCFEQIRVSVAYQDLPVTLVGVGGGLSYGPLGPTHHSMEDVAVLRTLPGMRVFVPADPVEADWALNQILESNTPGYLRLGKNGETKLHHGFEDFQFPRLIPFRKSSRPEFRILVSGPLLENVSLATDHLFKSKGILGEIWSAPVIKPFDCERIREFSQSALPVITVEEHGETGGLGSAVAEVLSSFRSSPRLLRLSLGNRFISEVGSQKFLRESLGLSPEGISRSVLKFVRDFE